MSPCLSSFIAGLRRIGFPLLLVFALPAAGMADRQIIEMKGYAVVAGEFLAKRSAKANVSTTQAASTAGMMVAKEFENYPGYVLLKVDPSQPQMQGAALTPQTVESQLKALQDTGAFELVEPNYVYHSMAVPNDPKFSDGTLWGLRNNGQSNGTSGFDINATAAWDITTGDSDVVVAVIDSGINYNHDDLKDNLWINTGEIPGNGLDDDANGYIDDYYGINAVATDDTAAKGDPMDDDGHGTHVAGTIGAVGNNGAGMTGVAWRVRLMGLKFLGDDGFGSLDDAIECIDYAIAMGADITNNSWGGGPESTLLREAIERAESAGILFIAASGNIAMNLDSFPFFPASHDVDNIISVGAIDRSGDIANFSNIGPLSVDLLAPGVDIYSTFYTGNNAYATYSGTSMAAPHVSGVAALILSQYPGISMTELKQRLLTTVNEEQDYLTIVARGGMVDAAAALTASVDGALEVSVTSLDPFIAAGETSGLGIFVSDLMPVTGATVTATINGGDPIEFNDDGSGADAEANDGLYSANPDIPNAEEFTFAVTASKSGKTTVIREFTLPAFIPPPNDDFDDRIELPGSLTTTTGFNTLATIEEDELLLYPGGSTVWYSWSTEDSGSYTFSTSGSDFDTTIAIYTGSALDELEVITFNDDAGVDLTSEVTFSASAGVEYQIQIDGYFGDQGNIVLNHPPGTGESVPVFTRQPVAQRALEGQRVELSAEVIGTGPFSYQWYKDSVVIEGATDSSYVIDPAKADDQGNYQVRVRNEVGSAISQTAFLTIELVGVASPNDHFAEAEVLTGVTGTSPSTTELTSGEEGEPNHGGISLPLASVWWRWTAPETGLLEVSTQSTTFDTVLAIYRGSALDNLVEVDSNDDLLGDNETIDSYLQIPVAKGATYYIAVDGKAGQRGVFSLVYDFAEDASIAANDDFDFSALLFGIYESTAGTNNGASSQRGEPNHAKTSMPLNSVWWSWEAPISGPVEFSTEGSNFDTTLAVYIGDALRELKEIASNDDIDSETTTSKVTFTARRGQTYRIAVDGFADKDGEISLKMLQEALSNRGDFNISLSASNVEIAAEALANPFAEPLDNLQGTFTLIDEADGTRLEIASGSLGATIPANDTIEDLSAILALDTDLPESGQWRLELVIEAELAENDFQPVWTSRFSEVFDFDNFTGTEATLLPQGFNARRSFPGNWYDLIGFGFAYRSSAYPGWYYLPFVEWVYPSDNEEGVWMYIPGIGWAWSNQEIYPYAFDADSGWIYLGNSAGRAGQYYDFTQDDWRSL